MTSLWNSEQNLLAAELLAQVIMVRYPDETLHSAIQRLCERNELLMPTWDHRWAFLQLIFDQITKTRQYTKLSMETSSRSSVMKIQYHYQTSKQIQWSLVSVFITASTPLPLANLVIGDFNFFNFFNS
jgi:hypothetical protein